jgi:hypothetical protein
MAWRVHGSPWSDVGGALAEFDAEEDIVLTASEVLERQASEIQYVSSFHPAVKCDHIPGAVYRCAETLAACGTACKRARP